MTTTTDDIIAERDIAIKRQLRLEYQDWLKVKGENSSPNNAHLFAVEKINKYGPTDYLGKNEQEIIQLLEA